MNISTKTGSFAADLLQVQPLATIGSIDDCRLEHTNRTTWMTPGGRRRISGGVLRLSAGQQAHGTLYGDAPWTIASVHRYLADG